KEVIIIEAYKSALKEDVASIYSTGFRVEYEAKRSTSHYLIHLTRNALGFRLMKEIMWPLGETQEGKGALALEQASLAGSQPLFLPEWDEVKASIIKEVQASRGRLQAKYFYETLSEQRESVLCRPAYKKALLELEAEGKVVVFNKKGESTTAKTRKKHN